MGTLEAAEIRDNAQAWAEHVKKSVPVEVAAIVIFYNRRTGDLALASTLGNPTGTKEILRAFLNNSDSANMVVPATIMPKM